MAKFKDSKGFVRAFDEAARKGRKTFVHLGTKYDLNGMAGLVDFIKKYELKDVCPSDDQNPEYAFQTIQTTILKDIANGSLDARELARRELANRGRNTNGEWIGFNEAKKQLNNEGR